MCANKLTKLTIAILLSISFYFTINDNYFYALVLQALLIFMFCISSIKNFCLLEYLFDKIILCDDKTIPLKYNNKNKISYKDSGVDIDIGNSFVDKIKPLIKQSKTDGVLGGIGGFAGAYQLKNYKEPIIFGATDGVGSKLDLAIKAKKFDTIGIDLVAMCVNDIICSYAKPLFFLDYYATNKLNIDDGYNVVKGIVKGCKQSNCALIGGESAEMPSIYKKGDFDLAGFCVGVGEKSELEKQAKQNKLKEGDILIALPSSGAHSNGYSLLRAVLFDKLKMSFNDKIGNKKIIDILLTPTKIYVNEFLDNQKNIKALAHITGGGICENLQRALSNNVDANIVESSIKVPKIFDFLKDYVSNKELYRTFNMGIGMIYVVDSKNAKQIAKNVGGYIVGDIKKGKGKAKLV
jgi:phosphoribosylformylglycinamidine cyclo-ligase